jgi:curved DNA-binding protein CbpA
MNHYEMLEVSANASQEVIRAAYRSLMQRYHPDRNPGNTETAQRALLVNQAYEVLSDANKRAAYDLELKRRSADHSNGIRDKRRDVAKRPAALAKDAESSWFVWLMIASIFLSGWLILSISGKQESPESELNRIQQSFKVDALTEKQRQDKINRIEKIFREHPEIFKKEASDRAKAEAARTIPVLFANLAVNLRAPGKSSEDPGKTPEIDGKSPEDTEHVLFIPILGIEVGTFDPEKAIGYIERNKETINQ